MNDRDSDGTGVFGIRPVNRPELCDAVCKTGELVSETVHALRNPVSALTTSLEILTSGLALPEDVPQLYQVVRNEISKLNSMLDCFHEMARLSNIDLVPHELADLIRVPLTPRVKDFAERGVILALNLPNDECEVLADEEQFGYAFDRLVSNALDAMPSGGTLSVMATKDPEAHDVVVIVRDTGVGIPAATLPNIFRALFSTKKGSAGMGLPIARQILLAHEGTIWVESEPSEGTTVRIRLPLR